MPSNTRFRQDIRFGSLLSGGAESPFIHGLVAVAVGAWAWSMSGDVWAGAGLAAFAYTLVWYTDALGQSIGILETLLLIAAAQWLVGPFLAYNYDLTYSRMRMYVGQDDYFSYVTPAFLFLMIGARAASPHIDIQRLRNFFSGNWRRTEQAGWSLLLIGCVATMFGDSQPVASLAFVFFLIAQVKFVAALFFIANRLPNRWPVTFIAFLAEAVMAAQNAMFSNILLWGALTLSFVCMEMKLPRWSKLGLFLGAVLFLAVLQQAKVQYRAMVWYDGGVGGLTKLTETLANTGTSSVDLSFVNARLNEGWIISAIMRYMPAYRRYQYGTTVWGAFTDALLPRALVQKAQIDQTAEFTRFTGLYVPSGTTFGISIVGEAWANFGWYGVFLMGFVGLFFGGVLRGIAYLSRADPQLLLWAPLIFLQAIKAETDLTMVVNHIVKASIFVFGIQLVFGGLGITSNGAWRIARQNRMRLPRARP